MSSTDTGAPTHRELVKEMALLPKTVLIVDDEQPILDVLRDVLEDAGYNILMAFDGRTALSMAHHNALSLILTDLMMPELDGQALCNQLRHDPTTAHLPIVLMTAARRPDMTAQFTNIIDKPFDMEDVLRLVRQYAV